MVKPLCDNSDCYFKAFAHKVIPASALVFCQFCVTIWLLQHRHKLASVSADTGIRIVSDAKRVGRGSAREAFLGALGRWAPVSPASANAF